MRKHLKSSVGKKFVSAISGLALFAFLIVHLGGNLTMFISPELFNSYAYHLESLGRFLYIAEFGLIAFFLFHVVSGVSVQIDKWRARPEAYAMTDSKGGPSRQSVASRSMLVTGAVLLVFIPIHVWMFKFGAMYTTESHGREMRDLFRLVHERFQDPVIVGLYLAVMFLLGFHLRHGFWSALQSLGAMNPKCSGAIYALGLAFAALLAAGFFILPIWIYLLP